MLDVLADPDADNMLDSMEVQDLPGELTQTTYPDGSFVVVYPPGWDGTEVATGFDASGNAFTRLKDGSTSVLINDVTTLADGTTLVPGDTVVIDPDGTATAYLRPEDETGPRTRDAATMRGIELGTDIGTGAMAFMLPAGAAGNLTRFGARMTDRLGDQAEDGGRQLPHEEALAGDDGALAFPQLPTTSQVQRNYQAGKAAEAEIISQFPEGTAEPQHFPLPNPPFNDGRFVDVLVEEEGLAIESKVGRTGANKRIREQIAKDKWILENSTKVSVIEWQFRRSGQTGKVGPTPKLERALNEAGIMWKVVE
jgi:hypothetical protein